MPLTPSVVSPCRKNPPQKRVDLYTAAAVAKRTKCQGNHLLLRLVWVAQRVLEVGRNLVGGLGFRGLGFRVYRLGDFRGGTLNPKSLLRSALC